jgi:glycosyltransferase involved in cell wall biosynthesis
MKKKILFVSDWPDNIENRKVLQTLLDKEYSENYEWNVWSCKKYADNRLLYRWYCYTKGALYIIKNKKKYDAIIIWQQMVGFILFEIKSIIHFKIPQIVLYAFIYKSNTRTRHFQKHMVGNALKHSKAIIWDSSEMTDEVKRDFPKFAFKNHFTLSPIMDVIDTSLPVDKLLDVPYFRNGVFTAGKSERDFNIVIRAFRNTDIPVTIVCPDEYPITETNITSNIRILRFSKVSHEQYYALAGQAFCILISVTNEQSSVGHLIVAFAMANSIPIISTDCYGLRDFIVHEINGLLFKLGQSEEILKSYEKLKNNEAFTNELIRNAKVTLKDLSPGVFFEKVIRIIESPSM